ncbi:uncharacterized protein [Primulina huaijiensis]|uniref:uncharacterized protein n=1 Tax=Primulina huaijiensis TaxID=1492673 RepID=UPI003CC751C9
MPHRHVIDREARDEQRASPPRPPPDLQAHMLTGMTQFFAQFARNNDEVDWRTRPQAVYERFRKMDPKDFGDTDRVRCATCLLKDDARLWWEGASVSVNLQTTTWEGFKKVFYSKYFTNEVRSQLTREFMTLRKGDRSVVEFVRKFEQGCYFVPLIANDAREKLRHFLDGLRPILRLTRALAAEQDQKDIEIYRQGKRPSQAPQRQFQQPAKRPFQGPNEGKGQQPQKKIAQKLTDIQCDQSAVSSMRQSVYGVLWKQPTKGRVFAMHAEEADLDTTLLTGRIYIAKLVTNALLDSGATHSFISDDFVRFLDVNPTKLDVSYTMIVQSGEKLSTSNVVRDLSLELHDHTVYADLIVLSIPEFDIILEMDWLSKNGVTIDFQQ